MPQVIYCWCSPSCCFQLFVRPFSDVRAEMKKEVLGKDEKENLRKMFAFFFSITMSSFGWNIVPVIYEDELWWKKLEEEVQTHMRASNEIPQKKGTQIVSSFFSSHKSFRLSKALWYFPERIKRSKLIHYSTECSYFLPPLRIVIAIFPPHEFSVVFLLKIEPKLFPLLLR